MKLVFHLPMEANEKASSSPFNKWSKRLKRIKFIFFSSFCSSYVIFVILSRIYRSRGGVYALMTSASGASPVAKKEGIIDSFRQPARTPLQAVICIQFIKYIQGCTFIHRRNVHPLTGTGKSMFTKTKNLRIFSPLPALIRAHAGFWSPCPAGGSSG